MKMLFEHGQKFDIQLSQALLNERKLGAIFGVGRLHKIELKSESWLWERTGNICIEYRASGKPSGIAVTEADFWVHELKRDGQTLCYLMFPIERLKALVERAIAAGRWRMGGDGGRMKVALVPLRWITL